MAAVIMMGAKEEVRCSIKPAEAGRWVGQDFHQGGCRLHAKPKVNVDLL